MSPWRCLSDRPLQVAATSDLVGPHEPVAVLRSEYTDPLFLHKIDVRTPHTHTSKQETGAIDTVVAGSVHQVQDAPTNSG